MPSYGKLKVAELRDLCDECGLRHAGLNKSRLIEALRNDDSNNDSRLEGVIASDRAGLGAEAELGDGENGHADDSGSDDCSTAPSADEATETESVAELKMQLALVQARKEAIQAEKEARIAETQAECDARREEWEIEKERMAMRASSQQSSAAVATGVSLDSNAVGNLKLMLPSMTNDDALSFFHAFERTLEINDVDRTRWIKFLPAQLSPKALKAFTSLTLEQSRDYDVAKRAILAYYKMDAHAYLKAFKSQRRTGKRNL